MLFFRMGAKEKRGLDGLNGFMESYGDDNFFFMACRRCFSSLVWAYNADMGINFCYVYF